MTWLDFAGGIALFLGFLFFSHRKGMLASYKLRAGVHEGMGSLPQVGYFRELCYKAQKNIYVVSGETAHVFWENDIVIQALKDALARGVRVQICAGPWFDVRSKRLAQLINNGLVTYYKLPQRNNEIHFWANDQDYVAFHDPIERNMEHTITSSRFFTKMYINKFYDLTRGLTPISEGKFHESFYIRDPDLRKELRTDYEFTDKDNMEVAKQEESQELIRYAIGAIN